MPETVRKQVTLEGSVNYEAITYAVDDRVALITLNRPERMNAFGQKLRDELPDAVTPPTRATTCASSSSPAPAAGRSPPGMHQGIGGARRRSLTRNGATA